jgi:hypothetical protein
MGTDRISAIPTNTYLTSEANSVGPHLESVRYNCSERSRFSAARVRQICPVNRHTPRQPLKRQPAICEEALVSFDCETQLAETSAIPGKR